MQEIRISDKEREIFRETITQAYSEGRLSVEEFEKRLQVINAAVFCHEAQRTVADLPQTVTTQHNNQPVTSTRSHSRKPFSTLKFGSIVIVGIMMLLIVGVARQSHIKNTQDRIARNSIKLVNVNMKMLEIHDQKITAQNIMDIEPSMTINFVNSRQALAHPLQDFLIRKTGKEQVTICTRSASKNIVCLHQLDTSL